MRYTREGWPRCCGDVMSYFVQADPEMPDSSQA